VTHRNSGGRLLQLDGSNFLSLPDTVPAATEKSSERNKKRLTREEAVDRIERFPKRKSAGGAARRNLAARKKVVDKQAEQR
jgi:hypothetical protein